MPPASGKSKKPAPVGIAWVELSSGAFEAMLAPAEHALDELVRIRPAEVVVADGSTMDSPAFREAVRQAVGATVTARPAWAFDARSAVELLKEHFRTTTLEGFGFEAYEPSLSSAAALLDYLRETQKTALEHIRALRRFERTDCVVMDGNTIRCLELLRSLRGHRRSGTLLEAIDATLTGMGSRLLQRWLTWPLRGYSAIIARQDAVEELTGDPARLRAARDLLDGASQIDRVAGNIAMGRVRPRELLGLKETLDRLPALTELLAPCQSELLSSCVAGVSPALPAVNDAAETAASRETPATREESPADLIGRSIKSGCAAVLRDGGVIADGFDADLDRLRRITTDGAS
jgi:DNA mismatch repair protein MutS